MSLLPQRCLRVAMGPRACLWQRQIRCKSYKEGRGPKMQAKLDKAEREWQERADKIKNGEAENLWDVLESRGFIKDVVGGPKENIKELMRVKRIGAYVGIDPTAPSLHIGHLLPLMPLYMMYMHGYHAVSLLGGATAKVGDPIGRLESREAMSSGDAAKNIVKIHYQLKKLWSHVDERARHYGYQEDWAWKNALLTNSTWWNKQPLLEILKRLGAFMRMGPMLSRESVKQRMIKGDGMSYAEFTYPLMQAWDWWRLYDQLGVQMQIGGSDQLGNILTGRDAVKTIIDSEPNPQFKKPTGPQHEPVGFTVPLLTDSSGAKFGKSAGNAIWLDEFMTSPFDLYGYFVRRPDDEIERLLKLFTFVPCADIATLMAENDIDRSKRLAHRRLAYEVLCLVHGRVVAQKTQDEHRKSYGGASRPQTLDDLLIEDEHSTDVHRTLSNTSRNEFYLPRSLIFGDRPTAIPRIVFAAGLADSVSAAQRLISAGGLHVAGAPGQKAKVNKGWDGDTQFTFTPVQTWFPEDTKNFVIGGEYLILRRGKHNVAIIKLMEDEEYKAKGLTYRGQEYTGRTRMALKRLKEMREMEAAAREGKGAIEGSEKELENDTLISDEAVEDLEAEDLKEDVETDETQKDDVNKDDKITKW